MRHLALRSSFGERSPPRDSIGGVPWVPVSSSPHVCKICKKGLQLFIQFDVNSRFRIPFEDGSHLVIFMCPECNDIPSFQSYPGGRLPPRFWDLSEGHYFSALYRPGGSGGNLGKEHFLKEFELNFIEEAGICKEPYISVGGYPIWLQDPEQFYCGCGARMAFIGQVSENYGFPKNLDSPPQPDSFSEDEYCLFLGNELYVFGCEAMCNERAIWITVQG